MKLSLPLAVLALAISLLGCGMTQSHKETSNDPKYRDIIGDTCELLVTIRAHGVTNKIEREKKTD